MPAHNGSRDSAPQSDDVENVGGEAAPDLQEALGVTPSGNCVRHPNCSVLSLAHNKIMSCRVCFSEEKSVGIRQRKSFAAVVHQLQQMSEPGDENSPNEAGEQAQDDERRRKVKRAHSASMQALILQQPQTMDSIMKRLGQVQNWVLRRKEKEVMSLKMQVQSLEEKLHDAEAKNQEQRQTIWALRRTIQQDMKIIKTMAVQKERECASQHGSPMNSITNSPLKRSNHLNGTDSPSFATSPGKTRPKSGSSHSVGVSSTPMTSPGGKAFSSGPDTPDPDDTGPNPMQGIILDNDPLLDKVRQKKKALQSRFEELRADNSKQAQKSSSGHAPGRPLNRPNKGVLKRTDGLSARVHISTRSLDEMVETPGKTQPDIVPNESKDVRSQYWNDEEYASLASDPTKIFASFRGGLLDIPKSPPAASHDNRQKNRPKLQIDTDQMAQLKMPRMRGVGRTLSCHSDDQSTDGLSVDGRSFDGRSFDGRSFDGRSFDGRSFDGRSFDGRSSDGRSFDGRSSDCRSFDGRSFDGQSVGSEVQRETPFGKLALTPDTVPVERHSIEVTPDEEVDGDENRSVSSYSSFEQPPPPPLHSTATSPAKHTARKPKRTVSTDEILDVVPEAHNEDDDLNSSKQSFMATVPQIPAPPMTNSSAGSSAQSITASSGPPNYAKNTRPSVPRSNPSVQDDETVDTTPTFFSEAGACAALSGQREQEKEKEKFLFTVTSAQCQDKYGDPGMYTGSILVTEGLPHGKGCMNYESGREYDGHWVSGQWHGHGKLVNPNGDVYEGEFVLDARHGKGEYRWDNGDVYTGDFSYDRRNGNGKFCFHNGNIYEGDFVDGMFEGFGRYDFGDGYYEGEWRAGRYHGDGELQYSNGGKYTGEFRESLADGFGVEVLPDGTKRRGVWERGQPVEFFHRTDEQVDIASRGG